MMLIDGSMGEGGGQVLRISLSLSALTGRPFRIENLRANRTQPGLRPQHLTAVRAVAALCQAEMEGARLESSTLVFRPGTAPQSGAYVFDVTKASSTGRSAGSVTLIMQAVLWPLLFADGPSQVKLLGGTFVPYSPPYHHLAEVARPAFTQFGAKFETELLAWGWMTAGGGEMTASVEPVDSFRAVRFETPNVNKVYGLAAVTNLPSHIPHRMGRRAHNLLVEAGLEADVQPVRKRGAGPGAGIVLWVTQGGFSSLGRKGLPADKVAASAVADLLAFVDNGAAVDKFLADQLLLPMALANGESNFTTDRLTNHTLTTIDLLRQWLDVSIKIDGSFNEKVRITVDGIGFGRDR